MARAKSYRTKRSQKVKPSSPTRPIKIYWWMSGTRDLYYSYLDYVAGDTIWFIDGGHCPTEECFLSEAQARSNPDPEVLDREVVSADGIVTELRRACYEAELALQKLGNRVALRGKG